MRANRRALRNSTRQTRLERELHPSTRLLSCYRRSWSRYATFWRSVWAIPAVCMENIQLQIYSETITALHVSFALSNALVVPLWNFGAQLFVFSISITFIHSFLLISSVWIECQARLLPCSRASFPSLGCGVFCCFRCLFVFVFFLLELRAEWYVRASATPIATQAYMRRGKRFTIFFS